MQRVNRAAVRVQGREIAGIAKGLLVFLGIGRGDGPEDLAYLLDKVVNLRVFQDGERRMERSVKDVEGEMLVVSQFTLYGDCRKGRRPSFDEAEGPERAQALVAEFVRRARETGLGVREGEFGAMMEVDLENSGPVTLVLDSRR